jgi:hypothetical protein
MRYLGAQSNAKDLVAQEQLSALISNPMTSIRDLIVGGVGGAPTRLPGPTSEGLVLTRIGNALAWAIATGFANPMTAGGDLIIGGTNGAATLLGAGTAGQVLTMVAGAPAWVTPSGGGGTGDFKKDGSVQMTAALNEAPVFNLDSASPAESIPDTAIALANTIKVSGTIGIRYLDFGGSSKLGTKRTLIFDNVLTLYHDLDYLILPGKVNITTAIGDSAEFVCEGPNPRKWRCVRYTRADGTALVGNAGFTEDQVRATVLTGLEPARDDVRATDTVLEAMGKLQASKVTKIDGMGLSATDFSQEEKTKLSGIQAGATANSLDSFLLARANHTGTQAISTVSGLQGALDGKVDKPSVQTSQMDRTAGALMPVGAFGLGKLLDLRSPTFSGSTPPSFFFGTGTTMGFIAGGYSTQAQRGLEIPALIADLNYGVLTTHGHWTDSTGGGGVQQIFTTGDRTFTRLPASATTWKAWREQAYMEAVDAKAPVIKPYLLGPVIIAPQDAASGDSALVIARELTNTAAINIPQALGLNFVDKSKASRLSAQLFRLAYTRDTMATGAPTSFDAMAVFTPVISANTPYTLRGLTMEGPNVAAGITLQSWIAARIQAPSGAGAVTSKVALMVDPNAGNALFGTITDNGVDMVQVTGSMSSSGPIKVGQYTLTTLPSASAFNGYEIDVTNSTIAPAGPKRCRSNGINWLILNTNTPVS